MIYRDYGRTGKKVSLLGFGGMRFQHINDHDECVRMIVRAARGGVNYFDTAPAYFDIQSETVFGKGLAELRRQKLPYYIATKTFETSEDGIRRELDAQLKRLGVDAVDFYHIWCVTGLDNWEARKKDGILSTFRKLKEEGLIKHICVSSHLIQDEIETLLMETAPASGPEGVFEGVPVSAFSGVLFGYSAYNFKTREKAFNAIRTRKLGAVVMNPLGGGIIPDHPELFGFLDAPAESGGSGEASGAHARNAAPLSAEKKAVHAALKFLWDHRDISVTLVGFRSESDVDDALLAMENYLPRTEAELAAVKEKAGASLEGICTGCGYCDGCPQGIAIPRFMDAYNQKLLSEKGDADLKERLSMHWSLSPAGAGLCTACGSCESACTQHIPIIERLAYIRDCARD